MIHGGAGTKPRVDGGDQRARVLIGMEAALAAGWEALRTGSALMAVVAAVASMEDSGVFNAGRGSVTTTDGRIETDAAVMDGATGRAGAICAATWPANPIHAALHVARLEHRGRGPILLAGPGADRLARSVGVPELEPAVAPAEDLGSAGTVGAVAVDREGHVAAATSTGGQPGQRPGRVGDSAIFGAGTWADDATLAVSAAGAGEAFVLAGFAHRVAWQLEHSHALDESLLEGLHRVRQLGGSGGAIAVTADGRFAVSWDTAVMARGWRDANGVEIRVDGPNS